MMIGKHFNQKCERLLHEAARISQMKSGVTIPVVALNKELGFERKELKHYLEFLHDRELLKLETIGGPLLYGHISLTGTGLEKVKIQRNQREKRR